MREHVYKEGRVQDHHYSLRRKNNGGAPYTLYVDGKFYCTCDTPAEAEEELNDL